MSRPWACGTQVQLYYGGGDQAIEDALDAAISTWNGALAVEGGSTPSLSRAAEYPSDSLFQLATVTVTAEGAIGSWCGATNVVTATGRTITLHRRPQGTAPCNGNVGTLRATLLHEVGHVLGLGSSLHNKGRSYPGVSDHCSIVLPDDLSRINTGICQHEIDLLLMAYEVFPNTYPVAEAEYWGRHILNRLSLPATVTLREDETAVLTPTGPFFQYAGSPPAIGNVAVTWSSNFPAIATVEGGNRLTPHDDGSATVRALVLATGLPSSVRISARLSAVGQAVAVTVKKAEWAPGFRVTEILGPGTPIVDTGRYHFAATVVNGGPRDSLRITWLLPPTIGSAAVVDSTTSTDLWLSVGAGSYTFRVTATPFDLQSDSTGGAYTRDYTVCTGQGIFLLMEEPNAVEGCGEPPLQ